MKMRLHMLTMDPFVARSWPASIVQERRVEFPDPLLEGPVGRRVAILDFDSGGALLPGVRLEAPSGNVHRGYEWGQSALPNKKLPKDPKAREEAAYDRDALRAVSVFATVHRVLELFESSDALGRKIDWAFPGEQLLVVPRAGVWANAFYDRATRSLQFFSFEGLDKAGQQRWVHTAESPDIVAHETAHAILDGIAPDLYDAISPEALAIHEAVADLTAIFFTMEFSDLRRQVLEATNGDLRQPTMIGTIAEEFGAELRADGGSPHLRSVYSARRMDETPARPHALSEVLSGAFWDALVREYERLGQQGQPDSSGTRFWKVSWVARRALYRALDYLPPGDCSFADLGRAIVASDAALYQDPRDSHWRGHLVDAFVERGIAEAPAALEPLAPHPSNPFVQLDLDDLVASDWFAYQLVAENRDLFCIPPDVPFEVRPRLRTEKKHFEGPQARQVRELIFKVVWWQSEPNQVLAVIANRRRIRRGSTLVVALDEPGRPVLVRLCNDPTHIETGGVEAEAGVARRDAFLKDLLDEGRLALVSEGEQDDARRMGLAPVSDSGGVLRIRELGAMLHMLDTHEHGACHS